MSERLAREEIEARAQAVKEALTTYYVIPAGNLKTVGLGERYLKIPTLQAEAETDPKTTRTAVWDGFMRTVEESRQADDPALDAIRTRTSPPWPPPGQDRWSAKRGPVLGSPAAVSITMVLRIELRARQG